MSTLTNSARALLVVIPAIALASPAFAAPTPPPPAPVCSKAAPLPKKDSEVNCADPSEPGSIIVYQKFQRSFVPVDAGLAGQSVQPRSLIELGATCPTDDTTCGVDIKVVRVNFHWVCPPQPDNAGAQFAATGGGVCVEND